MKSIILILSLIAVFPFESVCAANQATEKELLGFWFGKKGRESFGFGLYENGVAYMIGSMGIFNASWSRTADGGVCVLMPQGGSSSVAWKVCAKYNAESKTLVDVACSMVDFSNCVERQDGDGAPSEMKKLGEKEAEYMNGTIKQFTEERQEELKEMKKLKKCDLPAVQEAPKSKEQVYSADGGIDDLVECVNSHGSVSVWRGNDKSVGAMISNDEHLSVSVFLGEYVYGDETMTNMFDDIVMYCGEELEKVPAGAKLKEKGMDARLVRQLASELKAIGAESTSKVFSCPKSCYSTIIANADFKFKKGKSAKEVVAAVIKFVGANGSGKIMIRKL